MLLKRALLISGAISKICICVESSLLRKKNPTNYSSLATFLFESNDNETHYLQASSNRTKETYSFLTKFDRVNCQKDGFVDLTVDITTDNWGFETSWKILSPDDDVVLSGGNYEGDARYQASTCIEEGLSYIFTIYDEYGDGMCCDFGNGHYLIYVDGELATYGKGDFKDYETKTFLANRAATLGPITINPQVTTTSSTVSPVDVTTFLTVAPTDTPTEYSANTPSVNPTVIPSLAFSDFEDDETESENIHNTNDSSNSTEKSLVSGTTPPWLKQGSISSNETLPKVEVSVPESPLLGIDENQTDSSNETFSDPETLPPWLSTNTTYIPKRKDNITSEVISETLSPSLIINSTEVSLRLENKTSNYTSTDTEEDISSLQSFPPSYWLYPETLTPNYENPFTNTTSNSTSGSDNKNLEHDTRVGKTMSPSAPTVNATDSNPLLDTMPPWLIADKVESLSPTYSVTLSSTLVTSESLPSATSVIRSISPTSSRNMPTAPRFPTPYPTEKAPTPFPTHRAPTPYPTEKAPTPWPTNYPTGRAPTPYPTHTPPTPHPTGRAPTPYPTGVDPNQGRFNNIFLRKLF